MLSRYLTPPLEMYTRVVPLPHSTIRDVYACCPVTSLHHYRCIRVLSRYLTPPLEMYTRVVPLPHSTIRVYACCPVTSLHIRDVYACCPVTSLHHYRCIRVLSRYLTPPLEMYTRVVPLPHSTITDVYACCPVTSLHH